MGARPAAPHVGPFLAHRVSSVTPPALFQRMSCTDPNASGDGSNNQTQTSPLPGTWARSATLEQRIVTKGVTVACQSAGGPTVSAMILVVEDDPETARSLSKALESN